MRSPWTSFDLRWPLATLGVFATWLTMTLAQAQVPGPTATQDPRVDLAQARAEEAGILGELDRIDRQLHTLSGEIQELQTRIDEVETRRLSHAKSLEDAQYALDTQRNDVGARCAALYRLSRHGLARMLFGAETAVELRRRSHYLLSILAHDRARLHHFSSQVGSRKEGLNQVDTDRKALSNLQAELRLKESTARDERARRLAFLEGVRERSDLATQALNERNQASRDFNSTLTQHRAQQAPSRKPTGGTNASGLFRTAHGSLPWPLVGEIVRSYGNVRDASTGKTTRNHGIDIEAAYGTPFRGVFDGVVSLARFIRGYGLTVMVEHGEYSSVYAHANGLSVSQGDRVRAGDVLGYVGNSGMIDASGYRLHFEIRYNTTPQNPLEWLEPR